MERRRVISRLTHREVDRRVEMQVEDFPEQPENVFVKDEIKRQDELGIDVRSACTFVIIDLRREVGKCVDDAEARDFDAVVKAGSGDDISHGSTTGLTCLVVEDGDGPAIGTDIERRRLERTIDRKSTRLNSSH